MHVGDASPSSFRSLLLLLLLRLFVFFLGRDLEFVRKVHGRDGLNARDLRLIVINGYPGAAVVYNPGELNATIRRDGLETNGRLKVARSVFSLPERMKLFCV